MLHIEPENYLAHSTVEVTVPITVTGQTCPVTPANKVAWTEAQIGNCKDMADHGGSRIWITSDTGVDTISAIREL
jgi:hypothetical protein